MSRLSYVVKVVGTFYEQELQKTRQEIFIIERLLNEIGNKLFIKWKIVICHSIVGLINQI